MVFKSKVKTALLGLSMTDLCRLMPEWVEVVMDCKGAHGTAHGAEELSAVVDELWETPPVAVLKLVVLKLVVLVDLRLRDGGERSRSPAPDASCAARNVAADHFRALKSGQCAENEPRLRPAEYRQPSRPSPANVKSIQPIRKKKGMETFLTLEIVYLAPSKIGCIAITI